MDRPRRLLPALALFVTACGAAPQTDRPAAPIVDDPMLRSALRDPIMADPALAQQANADTVRPPLQPVSGMIPPDDIALRPVPSPGRLRRAPPAAGACPECRAARRALTLGALVESRPATARCAATLAYSAAWANRLPRGAPLYPDARVAEGTGTDDAGCALRAVTFASAAPVQRLLDFYHTRAGDAGYRTRHARDGDIEVLTGTRPAATILVVLRPRRDGGTEVTLTTDGGA